MAKKDYDKTLTRLIGILTKLSQGELLNASEFAKEYNVSTRTIQKDIYDKLCGFSIEKNSEGKFRFIKGFSLDKSVLDINEMILLSLSLSQFDGSNCFNTTSNTILSKLSYPKFVNPYFIKNHLEPIDKNSVVHKRLKRAIEDQHTVEITFDKRSVKVEPYKLTNFDGFWDLFAKDLEDEKIKTYELHKIKSVKDLHIRYKMSHEMIDKILGENVYSSWFEDGEAWEVVIRVNQNISEYFKRRKFLQSQEILEEFENGDLRVSFEVSHDEDIDNVIKAWLPDVFVEKPERYKKQIKKELQEYLEKLNKKDEL
jgi:predicted DNA-binding transcriptional regulator YafY